MSRPRWSIAAAVVAVLTVGLVANAAHAAQQWKGSQIMPSSAGVAIQDDNGSLVSMYDIGWPATVAKTRGRYLWIQDDGGYSASQVGGWIYCDDALPLAAAGDHFASELRKSNLPGNAAAWLYWMRGICWENAGDPGVAIVDYRNALRAEPRIGIDDIYIRLGRLIAQEQLLKGRGFYDSKKRDIWESFFDRAQQINPNRPQLFYDWGFSLSQACACTQRRSAAAARKSAGGNANVQPSAAKPQAAVAARGLDTGNDTAGNVPPSNPAKPAAVQKLAQRSAETLPTATPQPASNTPAVESVATAPAATPAAPTKDGAAAAVDALCKYQEAERLSPNWWQIPLAKAELMLDQCDAESPHGDRTIIPFNPALLNEMLANHRVWQARQSNPPANTPAAPVSAVPASGDAAPSTAAAGDQAAQAAAIASKPPVVDVIAIAIDDFDRAISLNPNALDAYRDRAEALRLANRMDEAQQSATTACNLCYFRQWRSLRTLAQICNEAGRCESASDYALRAAELTSGEERERLLYLWAKYGARSTGDKAVQSVAAAEKAGYVASARGLDDAPPKGTGRIEPPPGFVSLTGIASP